MADLQTITQELRGVAAGIERAQHAVVAADSRADEIAQRAMMTGFAGIAIAVQQLRLNISEIRQRVMNVGRSVSAAAAPVAGASGRPSPEEPITLLNPASEQVGSVPPRPSSGMTNNARYL